MREKATLSTTTWLHASGIHAAQFYEGEDFLHRAIVAFFAQGIAHGDPLVMITRRHTFDAVIERMSSDPDPATAEAARRVIFIDAHAALGEVMEGDLPTLARVERSFTSLLAEVGLRAGQILWFYGDMSEQLYRSGNPEAAITLEGLWSQVTAGSASSTMCGYGISGFDTDTSAHHFRAVCGQHTHVIPTEVYSDAPDDRARLAAVAALQQRVRACDAARSQPPVAKAEVPSVTPTVYVIDDDASVRRSLGRLLRSVDLRVETFASAEAFLESIDRTAAGCLIVDIQLVGMSGSDLQRQMADAQWTMPVIAMSGSHDLQIEAEALRLGARAFLRKPFDAQVLINAIARAFN
jgi:CheY-like chemotaxis protein